MQRGTPDYEGGKAWEGCVRDIATVVEDAHNLQVYKGGMAWVSEGAKGV